MEREFEVAFGSVTGRDHTHALRNNQDALAVIQAPHSIVAVVCDGCSSGRSSEVGAQLGARLIARQLSDTLDPVDAGGIARNAERIRLTVVTQLRALAKTMGGSLSQMVNDYFLFTVMAAVIGPESTTIIGIGDGVFAVNGVVMFTGPFENNAPPYLAYAITGSSMTDQRPELLQFALHTVLRTADVDSLLIGTDGVGDLAGLSERAIPGRDELVGPLSQFWENDRFYKNPYILGRRFNLINPSQPHVRIREDSVERHEGLLPDDTTIVVVRRRNGV